MQASPPRDVQLWALRQQRLLIALRDSKLRPGVLARLDGALRRGTSQTLAAMIDLRRLAPAHPPKRKWKVGNALPAGRLLALYRGAEKRFGVAWNVLAAVNLVETGFNKLRSISIAGAQGPMQFMPATWRAYGLGGDIHDPHDAILAAANLLHRNGAPPNYARALRSYNDSGLYVDAVTRFAREIAANPYGIYYLYCWQP